MANLFDARTSQDVIDCLSNDEPINGRSPVGVNQTPFIYHCENNNVEVAITLLQYGCNINLRDIRRYTGLGYVCKNGNFEFLLKLLEYKEIRDSLNISSDGDSPLAVVCQYGHEDMFDLLIEYGADPKKFFSYSLPLLHYSCSADNLNITDKLLRLGVDINERSRNGKTALFLCKSVDMFYHLYVYGPDLNIRDGSKLTALHNMIIYRSNTNLLYDLVAVLLEHGANPNISEFQGKTPLISAINRQEKNIVELLLKYGADPLIEHDYGKNAIDYANEIGNADIIDLLENFTKS